MQNRTQISLLAVLLVLAGVQAWGADRAVNPTFLRINLKDAPVVADDLTADGCEYRMLFRNGGVLRGVARYGEARLRPGASSRLVNYPREEQIYFVLEGNGQAVYNGQSHPIRREDFMYFAPGTEHGLKNTGNGALRVIVMGFLVPATMPITAPEKFPIANLDEVKKQVVGNHPPTTLYQLMIGDLKSTRDRLATGHVVTSLFIMEFAPGGTNAPHHHDREEEVYLLLDGEGEMVAGGGLDGVEGRFPAVPGDAYAYRMNTTVGFYNRSTAGVPKARILAVRSLYPSGRR